VLAVAAELLATLSKLEPLLGAGCSADRKNTMHEEWFYDDTSATLKDQRMAWRRVEADIWRLANNLIALGNVHRGRVLADIPPAERRRICDVLGYVQED